MKKLNYITINQYSDLEFKLDYLLENKWHTEYFSVNDVDYDGYEYTVETLHGLTEITEDYETEILELLHEGWGDEITRVLEELDDSEEEKETAASQYIY